MRRYFRVLALIVLSAAVAGCGVIERWFSPPAVGLDLSSVQSVTIADSWVGLLPLSPFLSFYDLTEEDGAWVGTGLIEVGRPKLSREEAISIPAEAVQKFVDILEMATLVEGEYDPPLEHTDDYPVITLIFQTDAGEIRVSTWAQGEGHVPWKAEIDGTEYIIDSDIPWQALGDIMPYLKYDVREALIDEVLSASGGD
jgi:hypothetical protein